VLYFARIRNGFMTAARETLFKHFSGLERASGLCRNLPEKKGEDGRKLDHEASGQLTVARTTPRVNDRNCRMNNRQSLRHPKFIALIEDKAARQVPGAIAIEAYVSVGNMEQKPRN
jgi:hypothetical protein